MLLQQPPSNPIIETFTAIIKPAEEPKPQPILYTFAPNDSLIRVSETHTTTWKRVWDKNTNLTDPDLIPVGTVVTIPTDDEVLADRPIPASIEPSTKVGLRGEADKPQSRGFSVSGNTYALGYCTHYAKQMRPDLPNRMGDAIRWPSSARAAGFSVGTTPRVGSIAQRGNHVSYVTGVNVDGTFNVREQNWVGLGIVSSRSNISPVGHQFIY